MQTFEEYRQTRDHSVSVLNNLAIQLRILGGEAKALAIEHVAKTLQSNDFRIIFCGEFKRGKSTLINAVLGQKALPMKVAPCTGVITEVKYAPSPKALIHPLKGDPFKAEMDQVLQYIAIQGNETPEVSRVELFIPISFCQNGITLIDSPGLNEDWRRTQISLTELNQADAVIMVLSCEMALSRSEMDFIESRLLNRSMGSFFVWNRYDAVWNNDQEIAALRERSQSRLTNQQDQVYYLSAREALVSQIQGDDARLIRSGVPSFINSIEQFLSEKRASKKLLPPLQKGKNAAEYAQKVLGPRMLSLLQKPLFELEQKELSLRPKLQSLEQTRIAIQELIDESIEDILDDLIEAFDLFLTNLSQIVCRDSAAIELPKAANKQERQDFLIRWYKKWLSIALEELAEATLHTRIQQGFSEIEEDLQLERKKFHTQIEELLHIEAPLEPIKEMVYSWNKQSPKFVAHAITMSILGICSTPLAVSLMGLGALRAWLAGQRIEEQERVIFAQALLETVRGKRSEVTQIMRSHLEEACAHIRSEINQELHERIQDTQTQLDQSIDLHKQPEQIILNKQADIEAAIHQINKLYIEISEQIEDV